MRTSGRPKEVRRALYFGDALFDAFGHSKELGIQAVDGFGPTLPALSDA